MASPTVFGHESIRFDYRNPRKTFPNHLGALQSVAIPNMCSGLSIFICLTITWLIFTVVAPIVLFTIPTSHLNISHPKTLHYVAISCITIGILYLLFSLRKTLISVLTPSKNHTSNYSKPLTHCPLNNPLTYTPLWPQPPTSSSPLPALIIYNPYAGLKKAKYILDNAIIPELETQNLPFETYETKGPYDATEFIKNHQNLSSYSVIIICGGDGTYNEVVNGILSSSHSKLINVPPLGIVPAGSSNSTISEFLFNDYAITSTGAPPSAAGSFKEHSLWSKGTKHVLEIAKWATRRIAHPKNAVAIPISTLIASTAGASVAGVNAAFLGMLGDVNVIAESLRWIGPIRYDIASLIALLRSGNQPTDPVKVTFLCADGKKVTLNRRVASLTCDLVQHWTDAMKVACSAQLNAGYATTFFWYTGDLSRDELLSSMLKIGDAGHMSKDGYFGSIPVEGVEVEFECPGVWSLDGEQYYHDGRLDLKVGYGLVRMVCHVEDVRSACAAGVECFGNLDRTGVEIDLGKVLLGGEERLEQGEGMDKPLLMEQCIYHD